MRQPSLSAPNSAIRKAAESIENRRNESVALIKPSLIDSTITGHLNKCWQSARTAKENSGVQNRTYECSLYRKGEYTPQKLAMIRKMKGSEEFHDIISVKCRAAESWLYEIIGLAEREPYTVTHTPIPDVPDDVGDMLVSKLAEFVIVNPEATDEDIANYEDELKDEVLKDIRSHAKKKVERARRRIHDIIEEGGWHDAVREFISDVVTYPAGILKGPIVSRKMDLAWDYGADGSPEVTVKKKYIMRFDRVSPFDIYPSPSSTGIQSSYLIELHRLERSELEECREMAGFDKEEIDKVLRDNITGDSWFSAEQQAEEAEERDHTDMGPDELFYVTEFWGAVKGQLLIDANIKRKDIEPNKSYQINAWWIGGCLLKLILNPHPLGLRPYQMYSFERVPGAFWGRGLPEIMMFPQNLCNAASRALVNNMAISSGPMVGVDHAMLRPGESVEFLYPWKIFNFDTSEQDVGLSPTSRGKLIEFFQPDSNANELMSVISAAQKWADEATGIPSYTYGQTGGVGGAGRTASGLSMLYSAAGKVIKNVSLGIDNKVIAESVKHLYTYLMLFDDDNSIKGDISIVASGSASLVAKEQQQIRVQELMNLTNNPIDQKIIGLRGRARMLRYVLKLHDYGDDIEGIVPTDEDIAAQEKAEQQMQQMLVAAQAGGGTDYGSQMPAPEETDAAGNHLQGMDTALFHQGGAG
jgi:hypothetical protein